MTSANVTNFLIRDLNGNLVETHSQNAMCKTHWGDLLRFTPFENYTITTTWLDEDEEYHEFETVNLKKFIDDLKSSKYTRWNTLKELLSPIRDKMNSQLKIANEMYQKKI